MLKSMRFAILCATLTLLAGPVQAFWPFTSAEEKAPQAPAPAAAPAAPAEANPAAVPQAPATPTEAAPAAIQPAAPAATPAVAAPAAEAAAPAAPATPPAITKGKVVETMSGGGYTYVCIEKDGQKRWAAMPPTKVTVGEEVEFGGGMEMRNFTSKSLNRSFDTILFCGGVIRPGGDAQPATAPTGKAHGMMPPGHSGMMGGQEAMPAGHPGMPAAEASAGQAAARAKASASQISGKVVETMDGGGYTYAAVEKEGQRNWVAIPPTKLTVGQEVTFQPGFIMDNFSSKALNRTFEAITFSGGVATPAAPPASEAPAK